MRPIPGTAQARLAMLIGATMCCACSLDATLDGHLDDAGAARAGSGGGSSGAGGGSGGGRSGSGGAPDAGSGGGAAGGGSGAGSGGGEAGSGGGGAGSGGDGAGSGGAEAGSGGSAGGGSVQLPDHCPEPSTISVPELLSCTGLYSDIEAKAVAPGLREFAPAFKLWSDAAEKTRWIYLPPGTTIDSSAPDAWVLPVGTKLFKEFRWKGKRVETRLFWKAGSNRWLKTSYHWNGDASEAERFGGGEVDASGDSYYIPSAKECDQCHKGRADRALGFEQVLLALPGATGMTLQQLVDDGLLSDAPSASNPSLGDDGTGKAAAALGYLHVNCGVSCHNDNPASEGYSSALRLRLPPNAIDGGSPAGFDSITTTVGVPAETPRWSGQTRIVAGSPEQSLLYKLISMRDPANPKDQMPPIGSRVVDTAGIAAVEDWIRSL